MMTPKLDESSEQWRRVGEVLSGYFAAVEAGEAPDRQALLQQNPDLASALAEYFEEHDRFDRMVEPLRPVAAASATAALEGSATLGLDTSTAPSANSPEASTAGRQGSASTQALEAAA